MRLLFITPKIKEDDDDFAFTSLWAKEFARQGFEVTVICLEKGKHSLPFPVYSLGKEEGLPNWRAFLRFQKLILTVPHDRVFAHMNPRWLAAGAWYWALRRIPTYLWYTHYTRPLSLKIGDKIVKRMFAATNDCLPQYNGNSRKVVTGHGIDTDFWNVPEAAENLREPMTNLLAVHRISKSKRIDIVLKALALLPKEYTLTHYGRPLDPRIDPEYEAEIKKLADLPELKGRVRFMGSVPMPELKKIYPRYRVLINMVPDTIDKTVLEAMYCGATPIVTPGHAKAIGFPNAPKDDSPEEVAAYIKDMKTEDGEYLKKIVRENHSLSGLVEKMGKYIRAGN
ncbi:glycosyltransferase family 4 protein [Candidatus Uhrbacteria bacterium]|nr:glycosyltransferase family 4 protein [Candidatus Uhrbacteria bacterium]